VFWQSIAVGALRGVLNTALSGTSADQLREAIHNGSSLWGAAEGDIRHYSANIPPMVIQKGNECIRKIEDDYGNVTNLVMMWLEQDQPEYHAIIKSEPSGYMWLHNQVYEILRGIKMIK
jgi:hypothetical protein